MDITELRMDIPSLHYAPDDSRSAFLACFSLVFDDELIMHSVKLIQGKRSPFLAMPCERKHDHCPGCRAKNHLTANFCSNCGKQLDKDRHAALFAEGNNRNKLYNDLVHPITNDLREYLLEECLDAYNKEKARPGSVLPLQRDAQRRTG